MPKLKTRKSIAKRFKITKSGKIKRSHAGKRHLLVWKSSKRKTRLSRPALVSSGEVKTIRRMLPYG